MLEFLIVHQDWFMLDISPPTQTEKGNSSTPRLGHNLVLVPSKDSEKGDENGWYHVDRAGAAPPMMVRRKTTLEHRSGKLLGAGLFSSLAMASALSIISN